MRTIDADALKEELRQYFTDGVLDGISARLAFNQILHDIDNAPTVIPDNDIFEWCTDCKEYDQEKHCCHRWSSKIREAVEEVKQCKLDELRPKGEWVTTSHKTDLGTFEVNNKICNQCKHSTKYKFPFCPWCGSDMRKGGTK